MRAAAAGNDAQQDLGLPERRVVGRDAQVARERELATATERESGDCGDDHAGDRFDRQCRLDQQRADGARFVGPGEFGDVGTRGKDALAAGEHDRAWRVGREFERREAHPVEHRDSTAR